SPSAFPKPPLPRGCSLRSPVQIVLAGALDQDRGELADPGAALEAHYAVDLRCVGAGAAQPRLIDDDFQGPAYFRLQPGGTDRRLRLHQPASPLFSHLARNGVRARAGRFISLRMRELACWNGTSRYGRILPSAINGTTSSTCG